MCVCERDCEKLRENENNCGIVGHCEREAERAIVREIERERERESK